jgi:hypothetical protein
MATELKDQTSEPAPTDQRRAFFCGTINPQRLTNNPRPPGLSAGQVFKRMRSNRN